MLKPGKKYQKTLASFFDSPVRSNVKWDDIEKLLIALGAEITEGRGTRVRIYLNKVRAVFHRPQSQKETDKGTLKSMRRYLKETGVIK